MPDQNLREQIEKRVAEWRRIADHLHAVDHDQAQSLRWCAEDIESLIPIVASLEQEHEDARMVHVRLDETRAKEVTGNLYERISWLIDLLTRENVEIRLNLLATGHEKDAMQAKLSAAEHRRAAAEHRAQWIVLDEELRQRNADLEAKLASLEQEQRELQAAYSADITKRAAHSLKQLHLIRRLTDQWLIGAPQMDTIEEVVDYVEAAQHQMREQIRALFAIQQAKPEHGMAAAKVLGAQGAYEAAAYERGKADAAKVFADELSALVDLSSQEKEETPWQFCPWCGCHLEDCAGCERTRKEDPK